MIIESPPIHRRMNTPAVADDGNSTAAATAPWSFETNWTVYRGSLDASVTFESPDFPIDSESTPRKPPLVLVPPPSSDYEPCEIKICFTQKHEIRQVYVRSTSRVYEIYCAPAPQSENEYLCTVRCSIASVEENLISPTDVNEADPVNLKCPNGELAGKKVAGENNNNGTNEDGWVEVKLPSGQLDEQSVGNLRSYQDYYEATAEMNDSDPCMSVTLRLLSLQNKGCVYVDEVYVFADPIDSSYSENEGVHDENPTGSKLMTMLLPALLQSARCGAGQLQDQRASNSVEKGEHLGVKSIPSSSTDTGNLADQPDEKLHKPSEAVEESSQFQMLAPAADRDRTCDSVDKIDQPVSQVDKVLEQLLSRVSRIEDICLRFEENMLKPISRMEERLQRVEQQIELLAKTSHFPESPSCSLSESGSKPICNDRNYSQLCDASELAKKETTSNVTYEPPEDINKSPITPQFLPTLIITAPEFSCCDEEVANDVLESQTNFSEEKPKKGLSIDDALAAALAGFSSSTTIQQLKDGDNGVVASPESAEDGHLKCTQVPIDRIFGLDEQEALKFNISLKVTAPDFTGEEDRDDDEVATPRCEIHETFVSPESNAMGVLECPGDSTSICSNAATEIPDNGFHLQEASKVVDAEVTGPTAGFSSSVHENDTVRSDSQLVKGHTNTAVKISFFDKDEILKHFPANDTASTSDSKQVAGSSISRDVKDGSECKVDLETPILEVKFSSSGNVNLESSLEVLLSNTETRTVEETTELPVEEKGTTGKKLLVELDSDIVEEVSTCVAQEGVQQDYPPPVNQETFTSLI